MKSLSRFASPLLSAVLVGITLSSPAWPQEAPGSKESSGPVPGRSFSLEFPGGTMAEYVRTIREVCKEANIILDPEAASVEVPQLSLNSVGVDESLKSVCFLNSNAFFDVKVMRFDSTGRWPIFTIGKISRQPEAVTRNVPKDDHSRFEVLSIRELTEGLPGDKDAAGLRVKAETVLSAVETALNMGGTEGGAPVVKYHADSGLVLVRGTQRQVGIAEEVVSRIQTNLELRRMSLAKSADATVDTQGILAKLKALEDENLALRSELERLKRDSAR